MNTKALDAVRQNALALSNLERAELARDLVASLDGPADTDAGKVWDNELCRRINEIEAGKATLLDPNDVLARVRTRLKGD
jgi:putative addiction module component (TIGR02574 family)